VLADARIAARRRGERHNFRSDLDGLLHALRLMCVSDAFLAQTLYRVKARLQQLGIPILPSVAHLLAMAIAQVSIGDPVVIHPGVYILHGQVVIDGLVEIHSGTAIAPFVTIGLRRGDLVGPTIGPDVSIGTGAKVLGNLEVDAGATIGANAVVLDDVTAGSPFLAHRHARLSPLPRDQPSRWLIASCHHGDLGGKHQEGAARANR
jgi:serine O-acetyltransferase